MPEIYEDPFQQEQERQRRAAQQQELDNFKGTRYATITVGIGIALLIAIILGCMWGFKAYGRYQAVQDSKNDVKTSQIKWNNKVQLNKIEIAQQQQRVQIAKQEAEIRKQNAIGIREAQDIINKTLTPLYVQHEMVEQLAAIAKSGRNSSVIYIPTDPKSGLPVTAVSK